MVIFVAGEGRRDSRRAANHSVAWGRPDAEVERGREIEWATIFGDAPVAVGTTGKIPTLCGSTPFSPSHRTSH